MNISRHRGFEKGPILDQIEEDLNDFSYTLPSGRHTFTYYLSQKELKQAKKEIKAMVISMMTNRPEQLNPDWLYLYSNHGDVILRPLDIIQNEDSQEYRSQRSNHTNSVQEDYKAS